MVKHVDSGGQVHLVTNIRKPRKWRRYEYLLSSGTLYINTGVGLASNIKIEMNFIVTTSSVGMLIGAYYDLVSAPRCLAYTQSNKFLIDGFSSNITSGTTCTANQMYNLILTAFAASMNTDVPLWLFARSNDNNNIIRHPGLKIYSTKIYSNNTLIRDFVPAQYNGQYGMWDLVEDKFYKNAGTGSFTVGPEMKNYDEIDEVRRTSSLLPAGVELYDYILSSTSNNDSLTQKIDTGVNPTNSHLRVTMNTTVTGGYIGGVSLSGNSWLGVNPSTHKWYNSVSADSNVTAGNLDTVIFDLTSERSITVLVNGTQTNPYGTASISGNFKLFCLTDEAYSGNSKLYYCKIEKDGILVRNFLPCTYLGEPGMWDTVENKFYRNQGTGLFTLGNKITLKEYEYLKTNATDLYINTGISVDSSSSVAYDMIFKYEANGVRRLMGPNTSTECYFGADSNNKYDKRYTSVPVGNIDHIYEKFDGITGIITSRINGMTYNGSFDYKSGSLLIFALTSGYNGAGQYFYSGKILKNDYTVRDFIPVSYNGTPGLWDKVEWKFYANAGSGSFTLGPEKKSGSIYLHRHLTNLFDGFVAGGLMTLSNGVLTGTGANSDTYFFTKTTQAVNTTSYYLVGIYVEGYDSATAWTFCSPQSNSNASLRITRDGWNWGYVKFGDANSWPIWDDANRTFSGPVPKITISDCRIYKIT